MIRKPKKNKFGNKEYLPVLSNKSLVLFNCLRMIRRKLTRLEVTLDDTKELDEFFNKPVTIGLTAGTSTSVTVTANNNNNTTTSKLSSHFFQKQLLLIDKDLNEVSSSIEPSSSTTNPNQSELAASNQQNDITDTAASDSLQVGYNPQPYNPTNRFQFNQDPTSQQLR